MKLLKKGILSTFQDLGRMGFANIGVNRGGAMDTYSLRVLNILLGNPPHYPALEMHFPAAEIQFEETVQFALFGGDFEPQLNGCSIINGKIYTANAGNVLKFKRRINGQRCYFGIKGCFDVPEWLGSYSQNSSLKYPEVSDEIKLLAEDPIKRKSGIMPREFSNQIRFVAEFEYEELEEKPNLDFEITKDSNRMGYRLQGEPICFAKEMTSSAVSRGTIQLLPDGQLIILMADAQTTGGYPKLGYVISSDLNLLTQLGAGDMFSLKKVSQREALDALLKENAYLETLALTLKIFP